MIKLTFQMNTGYGKELMNFSIEDKNIYYMDRIFKEGLRIIPKDEEFIKKVRESRNKYSPKILDMFKLTKEEQEEYDNAKSDEELKDIIKKDCIKKGMKLLREENGII